MGDLQRSDSELSFAQRKIFLLTHPRTASNLCVKLFATHPKLAILKYPFHETYLTGPDKLIRRTLGKGFSPRNDKSTYQSEFDELQRFVSIAEEQVPYISFPPAYLMLRVFTKGKIPLLKEHIKFFMDPKIVAANFPSDMFTFDKPIVIDRLASASASQESVDSTRAAMYSSATSSNPTVLPDSFMDSVRPVILIRHPARIIPSYYRAGHQGWLNMEVNDEQFPVDATLRWSRLVFDWYADRMPERPRSSGPDEQPHENPSTETQFPLVLDADDMINDEGVIRSLCAALQLDPLHVQFSWEEVPIAEQQLEEPQIQRFSYALANSTGIVRCSKDSAIDVVKEKESWTREFGGEVADAFEKHVRLAMHDYDYLRNYRLRPC